MSDEAVIRMLLTAIDSYRLDGDGERLRRAANDARLALMGQGDEWRQR